MNWVTVSFESSSSQETAMKALVNVIQVRKMIFNRLDQETQKFKHELK